MSEKVDILLVLGRGSKHDNMEARYMLRSIEKNGINVGKVFCVGYPASFMNPDKVHFVICGDMYSAKHKNILRCIEEAVKTTDISNHFLYTSDDHFYIKPTDFANYPYFKKGELPKEVKKDDPILSYHWSLVETRDLLLSHGYTAHNFSWHGNTHFDKQIFIDKVLPLAQESYLGTTLGVEPTCLMLNVLLKHKPFAITERPDNKTHHFNSRSELLNIIGDRECISAYDCAYDNGLERYLKELFPDKSKYEL